MVPTQIKYSFYEFLYSFLIFLFLCCTCLNKLRLFKSRRLQRSDQAISTSLCPLLYVARGSLIPVLSSNALIYVFLNFPLLLEPPIHPCEMSSILNVHVQSICDISDMLAFKKIHFGLRR